MVRCGEEAHRESVREGEEAHRESVRVREEAHRESVREGEEAHRESVRVREEAHRESFRERDEHGQTIMGEPAERPRTTLGDDGAARNDSDGHAGNTDNPGQLPRAPLGPEGQHAPAPIGRSTGESMSGAGRGDGHGPPPGGLDAAAGDGPPTGRDVDGDLAAPDTTGFRTETKPELAETDLPPPGAQPETNDCARCAATKADEWRAAHGEPSRGPLPDDLMSPDAAWGRRRRGVGEQVRAALPEGDPGADRPGVGRRRGRSVPRLGPPSGRVSVRTCSTRSSRTARSATSTGGVASRRRPARPERRGHPTSRRWRPRRVRCGRGPVVPAQFGARRTRSDNDESTATPGRRGVPRAEQTRLNARDTADTIVRDLARARKEARGARRAKDFVAAREAEREVAAL